MPLLGLNPANIDETYRAQDNFYQYSNGNWMKNNPCPPAYPRWGVFNVLNEANQERLKAILDDLKKILVMMTSRDNCSLIITRPLWTPIRSRRVALIL